MEKEIVNEYIKNYLKDNLSVVVSCCGTNVEVSLYLGDECITNDNDYTE